MYGSVSALIPQYPPVTAQTVTAPTTADASPDGLVDSPTTHAGTVLSSLTALSLVPAANCTLVYEEPAEASS